MAPLTPKNHITGRGIGDGQGVCICDVKNNCACNQRYSYKKAKTSTHSPNITAILGKNLTTIAPVLAGRHTG